MHSHTLISYCSVKCVGSHLFIEMLFTSCREQPTWRTAPMTCTQFPKKVTLRTPMVKKQTNKKQKKPQQFNYVFSHTLKTFGFFFPLLIECYMPPVCISLNEVTRGCVFFLNSSTGGEKVFWSDSRLGGQEQICCVGPYALCKCISKFTKQWNI